MRLSDHAIRHRTSVFVFIAFLVVMGLRSYITLPRESAPDITIPIVLVTASDEGVSPGDMESLVTKPLERKLKSIANIKEMTSTSAEGMSTIVIEFEPDADIDSALQKVRDKVSQAKSDLPDHLDDPEVLEISSSEWPILNIVIAGDVGLAKLKQIAEDLEEDVESVRGVLGASIIGGRETEIRVEFDMYRIIAYQLTVAEVVQAVQSNNQNMPSGTLEMGEGKFTMKVPGEFETVDEIQRLVVANRGGEPVYVQDIAGVRRTFEDRRSIARFNGNECVTLTVTQRSGENLLAIANEIKRVVAAYRERYAGIVSFDFTGDRSKDVGTMVGDLENNILSGMILVLVVIFLSLGLRNALLVALAIPFSMLLSFSALQAMGVTLNFVVLFSLVLALGMLVDNAIVIVENIYRHHADGKRLVRAAMEATDEVAWPVISSTATTVGAFCPLLFWPGIMGEFMMYLPLTVIVVLSASLAVALIVTPCLASVFVHVRPHERTDRDDPYGAIVHTYRGLLRATLRARLLTVLLFFGLLYAVIVLYGKSGQGLEFFPDTEPNRISVFVSAPEGTNLYRTNELARQAERVVARYGNVKSFTTSVGSFDSGLLGGGGGGGPNAATIWIDMVDRELRREGGPDEPYTYRNSNDTMDALRAELIKTIVGAEVRVAKEKEGPPRGKPVNVEISGDDYEVLSRLAAELRARIKHVPGLVDLDDDYVVGLPEFRVLVDKERAAILGLNTFLIGQMVKAAVGGLKIGEYREGEDEYDIVARLPEAERRSVQDILHVQIPDARGNPVPLSSVADVVLKSGLGTIRRIDQKRVVTVGAEVEKGVNAPAVVGQVQDIAARMPLPPGYTLSYTGESEEMEESQQFLTSAFLFALFVIALILVTQFNSVLLPSIIMTSVVLSFIGVFLSLLVTDRPFGVIMTGMGVISLAGVVVNNAIVLIDYIHRLYEDGLPMHEAVVRGATTRFRPVMLTAITTILGLVPMATGISFDFRTMTWVVGGESSQWWGPMATAVIYGLAVATLLTLFVVPDLVSLSHSWFPRRRRAFHEEPESDSPAESAGAAT